LPVDGFSAPPRSLTRRYQQLHNRTTTDSGCGFCSPHSGRNVRVARPTSLDPHNQYEPSITEPLDHWGTDTKTYSYDHHADRRRQQRHRFSQRRTAKAIRSRTRLRRSCWQRIVIKKTWCRVTRFLRSNSPRRRAHDIQRRHPDSGRTMRTHRRLSPVRPA
jgi:hypothetical protein